MEDIPNFAVNAQKVDKSSESSETLGAKRRRSVKGDRAETGRYRATNAELFSREITVDENSSKKIYSRDYDNLYPLRIEKAINNSPTGKRCANMMSRYIRGLGNLENFPVGEGKFINDIISESADDLAFQGGVFFKLNYYVDIENSTDDKIKFKPNLDTLDYVVMAVSKSDDDGYLGRFYVLKDDGKGGLKTTDEDVTEWYYSYDDRSDVILYQMYNDCKLKGIKDPTIEDLVYNYRGQVNYLNTTPRYKYALGPADSVYNDLDTEFRIQVYNNVQTRKGFLGKTVVKMYDNGDDDNEEFIEEVRNYLGAENSGNVLIVEVPHDTDGELAGSFVVDQLKPQFDDKLFEVTTKNIRQNIMGAFGNIPEPLAFSGTGALFGTSADTYTQMKQFYWEQLEPYRFKLEQELNRMGFAVKIESLIPPQKTENDEQ